MHEDTTTKTYKKGDEPDAANPHPIRRSPMENDAMVTGFKMLASHCPHGIEVLARNALAILTSNAGNVLEVSYQIVGGNQHCVSIVFEVPSTRVVTNYVALDAIEEPAEAGTTIRFRDGTTKQG